MTRSEQIEKHGITAKGLREILRHLAGERLSFKQAIHAKCFECMGYYADGKVDCRIPSCPLYSFMPYRDSKPEKAKRDLSDDQRKGFRARMQKARADRLQNTPSIDLAH